jgi:chromosomal replication initiation ATPase DnaA
MDAEAALAQWLDGKFFLVGGTDRNEADRLEQENAAREEAERLQIAEAQAERDREAVQRMASKPLTKADRKQMFDAIVLAVASVHAVSVKEIMMRDRRYPVQLARKHAIALMRELSKASLPVIGRYMGRDHSTLSSSLQSWERLQPEYTDIDVEVRALLGGGR